MKAEPLPTVIQFDHCAPQPWRNGGGVTREMLAWTSPSSSYSRASDWTLRVSVADIERDGPFSRFDGVDRRFAVLDGAGVELNIEGNTSLIQGGDPPVGFRGEAQVGCRLLAGSTRDLNLMVKRSEGSPVMAKAIAGSGFGTGLTWRALFTFSPALLHLDEHRQMMELPARSLCWSDKPDQVWHLAQAQHAYWLGFREPVAAPRERRHTQR